MATGEQKDAEVGEGAPLVSGPGSERRSRRAARPASSDEPRVAARDSTFAQFKKNLALTDEVARSEI